MTVRLRTAVGDEADFFALVAAAGGVPRGSCSGSVAALTRVVTFHGQIGGFYRLALGGRCGHACELDHLFVYEQVRGHGLGRSLVEDLARSVARHDRTTVRIVAHPPSAGFFRRVGAHRVGSQPPCATVGWTRPVFLLAAARQVARGA